MSWPDSELEYWSVFLSITSKDKPIVSKNAQKKDISVDESKAKFRELFH